MTATLTRYVAFLLLPALVLFALWVSLFMYRPDYIGHTLAGYGGTLCALAAAALFVRLEPDEGTAAIVFLQTALLCILLGAVAEATVFRLAIFDPIDFCLQSFGAVFAAYGAILGQRWREPSSRVIAVMFAQGGLFLTLGMYYAFFV
ncbi:MAG: hypothetical protein WD873_05960 [Candidatus Hydrogenedentales bacterium]